MEVRSLKIVKVPEILFKLSEWIKLEYRIPEVNLYLNPTNQLSYISIVQIADEETISN